MSDWQSVGSEGMLAEGAMQALNVGGQEVLLARVGGAYYATQERCPHLRGHLARGTLNGRVVTCPVHGSQFDVTTGAVIAWVAAMPGLVRSAMQAAAKPKDLAIFPTKVEAGQVWVQV
jgi:nitrite reductase/ring-hydroxylating ferredoxin subunit